MNMTSINLKKFSQNDSFIILTLGILQGLFCALSLAPFNVPLLGWLLPWPLFYLSGRYKEKMSMLLLSGLSCSFFFTLFTFYWMFHLYRNFIGLNDFFSALIFIPYALLFNLQIPFFIIIFGVSLRNRWEKYLPPRWFTAGFLALIVDYFIPRIFSYSWANSIAGNSLIVQMTDIFGIYGLTFFLFAVSYFFYNCTSRIFDNPEGPWGIKSYLLEKLNTCSTSGILRFFLPVPLMIVLALTYGITRKTTIEKLQKELPRVRVAIINPCAPPEDEKIATPQKISRLMHRTIPDLVKKAAESSAGPLDLVVLPESAVPFYSAYDNSINRKKKIYSPLFELMIQLIAYNWDCDVFFNETVYNRSRKNNGKKTTFKPANSSVLYSHDGIRREMYSKRILLAFGEYLPGEEILEYLGLKDALTGLIGDSRFARGTQSNCIAYSLTDRTKPLPGEGKLLKLSDIAKNGPRNFEKTFPADRTFKHGGFFLPLICYEVLFPQHVRSFFYNNEKRDPGFIVNITQDGWYGPTIETYQHFELGRVRAVETRRALVRAVNNGAAGFVDLTGTHVTPIVGPVMTKNGAEDFQVWDVPVNTGYKTFYIRYGDRWIGVLSIIFICLTVVYIVRNRLRGKNQ